MATVPQPGYLTATTTGNGYWDYYYRQFELQPDGGLILTGGLPEVRGKIQPQDTDDLYRFLSMHKDFLLSGINKKKQKAVLVDEKISLCAKLAELTKQIDSLS